MSLASLSLGSWPPSSSSFNHSSACFAISSALASLFLPTPPYLPKASNLLRHQSAGLSPNKGGLCWASLHTHVFQILRTLCRHHAISQASRPRDGLATVAVWERPLCTKVCVLAYATPRSRPAERVRLHSRGIRGLCLHAGSIFSFTGRASSL